MHTDSAYLRGAAQRCGIIPMPKCRTCKDTGLVKAANKPTDLCPVCHPLTPKPTTGPVAPYEGDTSAMLSSPRRGRWGFREWFVVACGVAIAAGATFGMWWVG